MITNYLAHLKGYRQRRRVHRLGGGAIALYFALMEYCNELGWLDWFCVPNGTLQDLAGLTHSTFQRARTELHTKGYVCIKAGRRGIAPHYQLKSLQDFAPGCLAKSTRRDTVRDTQHDTKHDTPCEPQCEPQRAPHVEALTKPRQETKTKTQEIPALAGVLESAEWQDYAEMRQCIKRPLTPRAVGMAVENLERLAPKDESTQRNILNQSTFNCWQGLFALKRPAGPWPPGHAAPPGKRSGASGNPFDALAGPQ